MKKQSSGLLDDENRNPNENYLRDTVNGDGGCCPGLQVVKSLIRMIIVITKEMRKKNISLILCPEVEGLSMGIIFLWFNRLRHTRIKILIILDGFLRLMVLIGLGTRFGHEKGMNSEEGLMRIKIILPSLISQEIGL